MTTARMITPSIIMTPTNKFVIRIYIPSKIIMGYDNIQKLTCQYFFGKNKKKKSLAADLYFIHGTIYRIHAKILKNYIL